MSDPQRLALAEVDRRFASLRLTAPEVLRRLRASIEREGIRHPVLVSSAVEAQRWVLLDGFKRVRVAEELAFASVWAHAVAFDATQSKAAILHANQAQQGLSDVEEAWIVRALCREHGLRQAAVGQLLGRDKSWVCRRLKLAESLDITLQEDLRLGLLSATTARELARLPRGNQLQAAQAVRDHELTSRQTARLVERLQKSDDPAARREVLADPLRFIGAESPHAMSAACDPRLSDPGNRLRRLLLHWDGISSQVARSLNREAPVSLPAEDARVLGPLVYRALGSARRASEQLEAIALASAVSYG
jgi:ParB-like chromosome segregation protein Spo0J